MCMGSDLAAHIMQQFQKFTDDLKNIYTVRAYPVFGSLQPLALAGDTLS
ncbi:hypothetical protein TOC8171_15270 [Pseudomonas syringae]